MHQIASKAASVAARGISLVEEHLVLSASSIAPYLWAAQRLVPGRGLGTQAESGRIAIGADGDPRWHKRYVVARDYASGLVARVREALEGYSPRWRVIDSPTDLEETTAILRRKGAADVATVLIATARRSLDVATALALLSEVTP
jgi:hypothetical protein